MFLTGRYPMSKEESSIYRDVFLQQATNGIDYLLESISGTLDYLAKDLREQAAYTLALSLQSEVLWPMVKILIRRLAPYFEIGQDYSAWNQQPIDRSLAPHIEIGQDYSTWNQQLIDAQHKSRQYDDTDAEAALYYFRGRILQRASLLVEAKKQFEYSKLIYEQLEDKRYYPQTLNCLGMLAAIEHNYELAVRLSEQALSALSNDAPERSTSYTVFGRVAMAKTHYAEAAAWYEKAVKVREAHQNKRHIAQSLRDLGGAYAIQNKFQQSLDCLAKSSVLFAEIGDEVQMAVVSLNRGIAYMSIAQYEKSVEQYNQATPAFRRVNDSLHLAYLYHNRACAYQRLELFHEAEADF